MVWLGCRIKPAIQDRAVRTAVEQHILLHSEGRIAEHNLGVDERKPRWSLGICLQNIGATEAQVAHTGSISCGERNEIAESWTRAVD